MGVMSLGDSLTETQQLASKHRLHTTLCTLSNVEFIRTWFHINLKLSHCTLSHIATQSAISEALGRFFGPCQVLVLQPCQWPQAVNHVVPAYRSLAKMEQRLGTIVL